MNLNKKLILVGIFFILMIISCEHESNPTQNLAGVSFSKNIVPILNSSCNYSGCHNSHNYSNFPLETYNDVINYGQAIPFKPVQSDFYNVLTNGFMPRGDTISHLKQQLIYDWIAQGALNN
jgi:hypothetical protein